MLRDRAPELLHWFHLTVDAALDLPTAELVEVLHRLDRLPPIGATVLMIAEGR